MTTIAQATSAIRGNLHEVFGEPNSGKRKEAIKRIWARSQDSVCVDPEKTYHGHEELNECVADLHRKFEGWTFTETSKLTNLRDGEGTCADGWRSSSDRAAAERRCQGALCEGEMGIWAAW